MYISCAIHLAFVAISVVVNSGAAEDSPTRRRKLLKGGDRFLRKDLKPKPTKDAGLQKNPGLLKDVDLNKDDEPSYYGSLSMPIMLPKVNELGLFGEALSAPLEAPESEIGESVSMIEGFESVPAVPDEAGGAKAGKLPAKVPVAPLFTPEAGAIGGAKAGKLPEPEFNEWGALEESLSLPLSSDAPESEIEESVSMIEGFESVPAVPDEVVGGGKAGKFPAETPVASASLSMPEADAVDGGSKAGRLPEPEFNEWGALEESLSIPMEDPTPEIELSMSMFEGHESVPAVPDEVVGGGKAGKLPADVPVAPLFTEAEVVGGGAVGGGKADKVPVAAGEADDMNTVEEDEEAVSEVASGSAGTGANADEDVGVLSPAFAWSSSASSAVHATGMNALLVVCIFAISAFVF